MSVTYGIDDDRVAELSPSAKLVYLVLARAEDELTQQEIVEASTVAPRTARHALEDLEDVGAIVSHPHYKDARQKVYYISLTDKE